MNLEPRIRARRARAIRSRKRRRAIVLLLPPTLILLTVATLLFLRSSVVSVSTMEISGGGATFDAQVRHALKPLLGTSLFRISQRLVDQSTATVSAVATATVTKSYPGTLKVHITLRRPVATVQIGVGEWGVIDDVGVVYLRTIHRPTYPLLCTITLSATGAACASTNASTLSDRVLLASLPNLLALTQRMLANPLTSGFTAVGLVGRSSTLAVVGPAGSVCEVGDLTELTAKLNLCGQLTATVAPGHQAVVNVVNPRLPSVEQL